MSRAFLPWILLLVGALLWATLGIAAEPKSSEALRVSFWNFDEPAASGEGPVKDDWYAPGPRPPRYPGFSADNRAAEFRGVATQMVGSNFQREDAPDLRWETGEALTMEAWISPENLPVGKVVYLVYKGDADPDGPAAGNLNYALLLRRRAGESLQLGFAFTSEASDGQVRSHHQWWSNAVSLVGRTWHHLAISYTFGDPASVMCHFDGRTTNGKWDDGQDTIRGPVANHDVVRIGGSPDAAAKEFYTGRIDSVAIHRGVLPATVIADRYQLSPAPPPDKRADVKPGEVLVEISERGVPPGRQWPEEPPAVSETLSEDVFGLFQFPQRYASSGVRANPPGASLVRASALVSFPKGRHRILLRARGTSRLFIDGQQLLSTPLPPVSLNGHHLTSDQDDYLDLGPEFRFAPPGNREAWGEFESSGREHLVVMETVAGLEVPGLGETVVAWSREGETSWQLLSPGRRRVPYTDAGWAAYEAERRERLERLNTRQRSALHAGQADYWSKRRRATREWLAAQPEISVPALPAGYPALNVIDHFIAARIAESAGDYHGAKRSGLDYFKDIQPLLESRCYDCHHGAKVKGGLHLDNLTDARRGGDGDGPAVVPGDPGKSSVMLRVRSADDEEAMPPKGDRLSEAEISLLEQWIKEGANWPAFRVSTLELPPLSDDLKFLRRVTLDTVGVVPTEEEIRTFLSDGSANRRAVVIDRLLADPRWADHWVGYWQDVLAENPSMLPNGSLNNTGPFRWWIFESLRDDKPMDAFVTELVQMEGSGAYGGPAGFGLASQNDAPLAEKGAILSSAFLGVEMKCARCHDAPTHVSLQKDLFQLAAMLEGGPVTVPASSSVPKDKLHEGGRVPLIQVTLEPGTKVNPEWPFARFCDEESARQFAARPDNTRDRLAAFITAPQNQRFAEVMANRVWQRLMGRGIVENIGDWEKGAPTHPELLRWLAREFVRSEFSLKAVSRLILNSHAYQRASLPALEKAEPLYVGPAPRRMTAEQIVDGLFAATGKRFPGEELTMDLDGISGFRSLGKPQRAWMLASNSNERDRPGLSLPRIQSLITVMEAFGWRSDRQFPVNLRESEPNVQQPAVISNTAMAAWLTVLSDDHGLTALARIDQPLEQLVERLFLRLLTRWPTDAERVAALELLKPGYHERLRPLPLRPPVVIEKRVRPRYVTWSNHLDGPANIVAQEAEDRARRGEQPTSLLSADWRERLEDLIWAMLNAPEWVFIR